MVQYFQIDHGLFLPRPFHFIVPSYPTFRRDVTHANGEVLLCNPRTNYTLQSHHRKTKLSERSVDALWGSSFVCMSHSCFPASLYSTRGSGAWWSQPQYIITRDFNMKQAFFMEGNVLSFWSVWLNFRARSITSQMDTGTCLDRVSYIMHLFLYIVCLTLRIEYWSYDNGVTTYNRRVG